MNHAPVYRAVVAGLVLAFGVSACSPGKDATPAKPVAADPAPAATPPPPASATAPAMPASVSSAKVVLAPAAGGSVTGNLVLTPEATGVRLAGTISGLTANAQQGFHVHEKGDCSAPDFSSAGGHFNPGGQNHGKPDSAAHHAGDMINLAADASGSAAVDIVVPGLTLGGGAATDAMDKAVVVHAAADDYTSQPAGNSGARVACGVIHQ